MRYLCEIKGTLIRTLVVEATSRDKAQEKVQKAYDNKQVALSADDHEYSEIQVLDQDVPDDFDTDIR